MIYSISEALMIWKPDSKYVIIGNSYSGLDWKSSDTKPTESEVTAKITELNNAEPMRLLRVERDKRLTATDWRASSDLTLADAWKTYRQSLRDLPASASPELDSDGNLDMSSVTFPTEPS
tara:strand:+ start:461 stop:820 length:360 start_codon:yes stop_codon:yes gene_type:complete